MIFLKNKQESSKELTDKDLVKAIISSKNRKDQRILQEELYHRYAEKIFYKCNSILKNEETAKDLTHDILVKIFLKLNKYRGESTLYTWIMAVTYNHCISFLEKEKKLQFSSLDDHSYELSADETELKDKVLKELRLQQLEEVFQLLKDKERIVLLMRYQDGMSIRDISILLKATESAIKMRLKRSRDHLAKLLKTKISQDEK
ncbi:MAG TPA: RNA polymerase sigma factor [Bacteroidetes bacterium]|nr:RNA polymerase sigma factor [Bacteroidota bacterium]